MAFLIAFIKDDLQEENGLIWTLFFLLLISDGSIMFFVRTVLFELLSGTNSNKSRSLYKKQKIKDKITLSYIKLYLRKNKDIHNKFNIFYLIELYSLLPQYISLIVLSFCIDRKIFLILLGCVAICKCFIMVFVRLKFFDASFASKYTKQYKKKLK